MRLSNSQAKALSKQSRGLASLNAYYREIYGERWPRLAAALMQPTRFAAVTNRYIGKKNTQIVHRHLRKQGAHAWSWPSEPVDGSRHRAECFVFPHTNAALEVHPDGVRIEQVTRTPTPTDGADGRFAPPPSLLPLLNPRTTLTAVADGHSPLPYYPLDLASVLAVDALKLAPHDCVFDMCAAPGGKSVCIAQHLHLEQDVSSPHDASSAAVLHVNDVSAPRRRRLTNVLRSYLPTMVAGDSSRVHVHALDLLQAKVDPARYDCVLCDAPCSTDRHTLHSPAELADWSPARFRRDAERQTSLLLQALRAVKVGGTVVYATCSLTPTENDGVIDAVRAQCDKWNAKGRVGRDGVQIDFIVDPIQLAPSATPPHDADATSTTRAQPTPNSSAAAPITMPFGEATNHGWMVLPDQPMYAYGSSLPAADAAPAPPTVDLPPHGFGPLYIARLRRIPVAAPDTTDTAPPSTTRDARTDANARRSTRGSRS